MDINQQTIFGNDPNLPGVLRIETEEDAWTLLQKLQKDDFDAPDDLIFGDWCNLEICLQGEKWHSSITPSVFPVFQTLQKTIWRAYSEAKYGNKNKRLTKDEYEKLEIIIRVTEGSSIIETLIKYGEIAKAAVGKMESKDIKIAIIVTVLVMGGVTVHRNHAQILKEARLLELSNKDKKETLEALKFSSEEETKRIKILTETIKKNELAKTVYEDSEELHNEMIRSATRAEKSTIEGVELDKETANELMKSKKASLEPLQINGFFQVMKLEWYSATLADITLKRVEDGQIVKAAFDLAWFDDEHKEIIKNAEWDEENPKIIKANINARISSDDRIISAELVRVNAPSSEDYNNIQTSAGQLGSQQLITRE